MASNFYTVKTLFRSQAKGRPKLPDRFFDPDATLLEERIQLIKAKSRVEALKKAEKDAREYAKRIRYQNPYDQDVTLEYLGLNEIFEVEHALQDKTEIYSSSRIISQKTSVSKIAHTYLNKKQSLEHSKRKKFVNKAYFHDQN